MRFFSGLSFGRRGLRAGVTSSGHPWVGARGGAGGAYVGVRATSSDGKTHDVAELVRHANSLGFEVDDDGRVFLGRVELDVEDLREVIRASDEASNREGN